MDHKELTGFQKPRPALDEWTTKLYQKHNLGETPSLQEIEPVSSKLFASPLTTIEGAELVFGREINASESEILAPLILAKPEEKFAISLLLKACEEKKARAKKV